jgi:streptogramin lyase
MARVSMVAALAGAVLLAAGCSSGAPAAPSAAASAATDPSSPPAVASIVAPSAGPSGADLPGLNITATVDGVAFPAALVAADDAVWALGHTDAKWSRIDPATNAITDTVSIGGSYATGGVLADGKLWALDFTDQQVVGVDPATRKVVAKVPVGIDGGWLVGDKAALWAIGNDSHELIRIDPKTRTVTRFTVDPACGSTPVAGGGSVWLVSGSGHLCKIDPTTGQIVGELDGVGSPHSMFWAADRIVMPNDEGGAVVVDPAAMTVEAVVPPPPAGTFNGAKYSLSSPETQDSVSMLDAAPAVWVRYTGATVGRLDLSGPPAWTVYAGLPPSNDGAPMLVAFDSFWAADIDGDAVIRADVPK